MKCGNVTLLSADKILAMPTLHCLNRFLRETKRQRLFCKNLNLKGLPSCRNSNLSRAMHEMASDLSDNTGWLDGFVL